MVLETLSNHFGILRKFMNYLTQNILVSIHKRNQLKSRQNTLLQCS